MKNLKNLLSRKVIGQLLKIEGVHKVFDLYDLKLHEVACLENCDDDNFYDFCCESFTEYSEFSNELYCIDKHIGRTSSFIITTDDSSIDPDAAYLSYTEKIELLVNEFLDKYLTWELQIENLSITYFKDQVTFNFDFIHDIDSEKDYEEYIDYFNRVEKDLIEFIEYNITNVLKVQEYINDFKKNQVEYFNDFLDRYCL
jgi:hypothetical protein